MAFFDGNLRALKIALEDSEQTFAHMVGRLTKEPADFFNLDVGALKVGSQADLVLLDPAALAEYDGEASIEQVHRDIFGCQQLVNRSDGVVKGVFVAGKQVWQGEHFTSVHGQQRLGRALRVGAV